MDMKVKKILFAALGAIVCLGIVSAALFAFFTVNRKVSLDEPAKGVMDLGTYGIDFDDKSGLFFVSKDDVLYLQNAHSEYKLNDSIVRSTDYESFEITRNGNEIAVLMQSSGLPDVMQTFAVSEDGNYIQTRLSIISDTQISTNYIAPVVTGKKSIQTARQEISAILEIPFDNDGWKEFETNKLYKDTVSYEAGVLFNPTSGGIILGSLEHTVWKTAVETKGGLGDIDSLRLYCGAVDPYSGDVPHGQVSGEKVSSPLMFIGVFDDWQDGMLQFARANTDVQPKRAQVTENVPVGWNSWGSVQQDLNYETAVNISDYVKDNFQHIWEQGGGAVYINLDSYWDMLSDEELKAFVDHCHENGQLAGIYSAPYVMWYQPEEMAQHYVPGTNDTVTYQDITLKKPDGTYYGNEVDGCIPLDVTHPATKQHVKAQFDRFKKAGFDYIKLDFLVHASFEGDFYDESITTGIQAYNSAMEYVNELLGDEMFVNLAMSPIFPYQYANGRRLACDAYYSIDETEYTLNAVTYGFWEQELYDFTDPDHVVVWGRDGKADAGEARSRATSGVISGTSFLTGDNFVSPAGNAAEAQKRFKSMFSNTDIIRAAERGGIFKAQINSNLPRAANVYRLTDGSSEYIAVFNFSSLPSGFKIDLGDDHASYNIRELWSGEEFTAEESMKVRISGGDAALYEITEQVSE